MRRFKTILFLTLVFALAPLAILAKGGHREHRTRAQNDTRPLISQSVSAASPRVHPHHGVVAHDESAAHGHSQDAVHHGSIPAEQHVGEHGHAASASHLATLADHDHVALADMHNYAAHHFVASAERPETFGAAAEWARDWELRWIDYDDAGHVIRIYHATSKHDDNVRYTSLWDSHRARYHAWEPAP